VLFDWALGGLLKRETVSLSALQEPRAGFESLLDEESRDR
jgi:NADH dehydrogenase